LNASETERGAVSSFLDDKNSERFSLLGVARTFVARLDWLVSLKFSISSSLAIEITLPLELLFFYS